MAVLLSGTTIGGHVAVHANNISTYALTSIPATISPTNIYIGNAIYFGGGNNYFNWDGARINSNVGIQSTSDMRAPIFYDSNDTSFYLDPNAGKSLRIAGGIEQNNLVGRPFAQWGQGGAATGAVVIKFPGDANNYGMVHAVVDIYEYSGNNVCTIVIGGHNWGNRWYAYGANMVGFTDKPVRLAFKDGKYAIVIGNDSSSWSYGQVVLRKIQNGSYYAGIMDVASGYTVGIEPESSTWISEDLRGLRVGGPVSATNISTGVTANHIVQRDANGYIYANHINFNTTESENPTISSFITSNGDGWSRKSSLAHVRNQLGNYGNWITTDGRAYPRRSDGTNINFYWDGQGGQPTWLWGSNNGVDFYVWNPSNFSVDLTQFQAIPDNRGNAYQPNNYAGQRVWWHFNNKDAVGGYGTYWHAIQTVSPWTSYDSSHRQQQIQWGGTDISFRYATSGTTWSSWFRFITDANIASQSVSYADESGFASSAGSVEWTSVQNKPATFPPSSHNHDDRYFTESESDGRFQPLENQRLSTSNGPTFDNIYNNGWFRNNNANQGLYNQSTTMHWSSQTNGYWDASSTNAVSAIRFWTGGHLSAIRGYVYSDTSNEIGFLNRDGNWSLKTNLGRHTILYGNLTVGQDAGASSIYMHDSDEGTREIHCNSNRIGFLNQSASWGSWCNDNGSWENSTAMYSPIFYDSNDTTFFLDPNADLSLRVYGEICNSNYAEGKMQPGALNIGRIDTNYAWDGGSWASDVRLGLLANTSETWEFGIHDSNDSVMSVVHFDGGSTLTMGRNLGWGQCVVNAPSGYVSNGNAWNTANSAFFPNGITTAGGTNWIYGFTYIGNAPGNGAGHEFTTSGTQYSTGSITTPLFLVNNHSDNTKGYRIHNTSGSSVSAMFTNSANALVIGAGAFDQVQLNKKVLVSGAALGVNVAASATAGRIDASNDIVAYSSSDERLKENITPIENALDKVKSLTGVEFDWKPEYKHAHGYEGHDTGIIAQQVQDVMPSAVRTNDTGFLAVRYEKLIGLLIEGMKEQQAQIDELKAKLDGIAS